MESSESLEFTKQDDPMTVKQSTVSAVADSNTAALAPEDASLSAEQSNSANGQKENGSNEAVPASCGDQPSADVPAAAGGPNPTSNFEFKYTDSGYHYYTDPEGKWYAMDEAGYWYYQDAEGTFKTWEQQAPTAAAADSGEKECSESSNNITNDADKSIGGNESTAVEPMLVESAVEPMLVEETPDNDEPVSSSNEATGEEDTMEIPLSAADAEENATEADDHYTPIIPIGQDGRPQYPRRSDGRPLLPIGPDGKKVFPLGPDGNPLFPVDDDGRPTFPLGDDGQPVFPIGPQNKPIVPLDKDGNPVFPIGPDNAPIFPRGPDGKPCAPVTVDGRSVLPRDHEGKPVVPYDHGGQPLIHVGPDGVPMDQPPAPPPQPEAPMQTSDWDAYYQQYYQQYYNYQYYYPYGTNTYGSLPYGGHSYAGFSGMGSQPPPVTSNRRVRPEDIDLPPGPPPADTGETSSSKTTDNGGAMGDTNEWSKKREQDKAVTEDSKQQSATKQLVARQMRAISLINQFKKESGNKTPSTDVATSKTPTSPREQQQPSGEARMRRSRFDLVDKSQLEQTTAIPASTQKFEFGNIQQVQTVPSSVRPAPLPPGTEAKASQSTPFRSRSRSPVGHRGRSPTSRSPRRSSSHKRSHSRSPRRYSRSPSPGRDNWRHDSHRADYGRGSRRYGRGRDGFRGRYPRRSPHGRYWRGSPRDRYRDRFAERDRRSPSGSDSRSSRSKSSSPSPTRPIKETTPAIASPKESKDTAPSLPAAQPPETQWAPVSYKGKMVMVRSAKDDGAEMPWERDMLAKTHATPSIWYSCRPDYWQSFETLLLEKAYGKTSKEEPVKEPTPTPEEESLESQMYGPKIPSLPTNEDITSSGKWKPFTSPEEKEPHVTQSPEEQSETENESASSEEEEKEQKKSGDAKKRKKKKKEKRRPVDPELDTLRRAALATMEQAKRDYEYYEKLAKQLKPGSSEEEIEDEAVGKLSTKSQPAEAKKRQKSVEKKHVSKSKEKRVNSDDDEEESAMSSSDDEIKRKKKAKKRQKSIEKKLISKSKVKPAKSDDDESAMSSSECEPEKKKKTKKRHKSIENKQISKKGKPARSDDDDDDEDEESAMSTSDEENKRKKRKKRKVRKQKEEKRKKQRKDKHQRRRHRHRRHRYSSSNDDGEESNNEKVETNDEKHETKPVAAQSGNAQNVKRGFFMSGFGSLTGPATLPDIPLPRECYSSSVSQQRQNASPPPPPPPKEKKPRISSGDSPPPPPPPKKSDFARQQFGSPQPKVGQPAASQPVFVSVATYRPMVPPPASSAVGPTSILKQNYPYGSNR